MPEGSGHDVELLESCGFVGFLETGEAAAGEYHCSSCGYGVVVQRELPRCPMCSGTHWEQGGWGAFRRRAAKQLQ
ncbi:MAG: hypothetical protein JWM06_3049 [Actinomycetia bacterium]|jgi:rubrerythrin|nr:hypothetical protein [Actinomycetes bacterium]